MRKLEWDHELVDLEHGYNLVQLLCKQDYERALIDGLWLIMAHYLTGFGESREDRWEDHTIETCKRYRAALGSGVNVGRAPKVIGRVKSQPRGDKGRSAGALDNDPNNFVPDLTVISPSDSGVQASGLVDIDVHMDNPMYENNMGDRVRLWRSHGRR
ncbi:hypothetical protein M9H77_34243 [Catharanthus roseus]|uniref:Uncharacterized protein n=1 Tax=Catharanthus roseus TaxID=4058 RepID=A0ACB9ZLC2_CATRO|nr:hypothetical protein M9H77_34243 [Catharanthus roseus]